MGPNFAADDSGDGGSVNAKEAREANQSEPAGLIHGPDLTDLILGQLGGVVFRTPQNDMLRERAIVSRIVSSPLGVSVRIVVAVSSKEEMVGANAGRIVAVVAHAKAIRNRTDFESVGEPMGASGKVAELAVTLGG